MAVAGVGQTRQRGSGSLWLSNVGGIEPPAGGVAARSRCCAHLVLAAIAI